MKALYLVGLALAALGAARGWPLAILYGMALALLGVFLRARRSEQGGSPTVWLIFAGLVLIGVFSGPPVVAIFPGVAFGLLLLAGLKTRSRLRWQRAEEGRVAAEAARVDEWRRLASAEAEARATIEAEVGRNEALRALISAREIDEIPGLLARHAARFAPAPHEDEAPEAAVEAIRPLLDQARLVLMRLRRIKEQQHLSRTDWLTGLPNRRALDERLISEESRCAALGMKLARLMIDIDRFKRLNDLHGHAVGDQALVLLARHLKSLTRRTDFVARYGGEEFAMLLPETSIEAAVNLAERLRAKLREEPLRPLGQDRPLPVTVSIGVSEQSLEEADAALYRAKEGGRDRVEAG
jgi:diguanylate cyclase